LLEEKYFNFTITFETKVKGYCINIYKLMHLFCRSLRLHKKTNRNRLHRYWSRLWWRQSV